MIHVSQTKLKRKADGEEEERVFSRPAWVLDHNLCDLWSKGLEENMIPEDLRLTAEALAQVKQLCQWAERQVGHVAEMEQVIEGIGVAAPLPPQQQSPPLVPTVAATACVAATARYEDMVKIFQ